MQGWHLGELRIGGDDHALELLTGAEVAQVSVFDFAGGRMCFESLPRSRLGHGRVVQRALAREADAQLHGVAHLSAIGFHGGAHLVLPHRAGEMFRLPVGGQG